MSEYNAGKFNLRLKILLNTYTKKKLEYLASELEKEILLLIQIINLKTNSNTLQILHQVEDIKKTTGDEAAKKVRDALWRIPGK